jgi:hypothetical protein
MYQKRGYFERRRILREANYLDLTPLPQHPHELDEEGMVKVLVPRFTGLFGRLLQARAPHPHIHVSLDELGSAVWQLCDGHNNVRSICDTLEARLGEKIHPARDRVTRFLSQLYKNNLIVFREIIKQPNP